jgi:RNA polymerase sigma-70 factor (ECF subfamily)
MSNRLLAKVVQSIYKSAGAPADPLGDDQLLQRFADEHDSDAFATLLERHGPRVLLVCRQMLHDYHAAEDVFQATFLILARKPTAVRQRQALGAWLYRVASNLARTARTSAARRLHHERNRAAAIGTDGAAADTASDWQPILHEEVNRLPAKYRTPVLLCYWEGQTNEQAAAQLGWPLGTVKIRLTRARDLLRRRLARRGVTLATGAIAATLGGNAGAVVPASLARLTLQAVAAASVPASVATLVQTGLRQLALAKLPLVGAILVGISSIGVGLGVAAYRGEGEAHRPDNTPFTAAVVSEKHPPAPATASALPADEAPDPVLRLREALRVPVVDLAQNPDEGKYRRETVSRRIEALRGVGDLARALELQEWLDQDQNAPVRAIDQALRDDVVRRFERAVRDTLRNGHASARLAVVELLGDIGATVRSTHPETGVGRSLAPDLARMVEEEQDTHHRAAAASALGRILPDPSVAVPALAGLFNREDVVLRRAASAGLDSLAQGATQVAKFSQPRGQRAPQVELVQLTQALVPVAGRGVPDADPEVRRQSLAAIAKAARALLDMIPHPATQHTFAPEGRPWSAEERRVVENYIQQVGKDLGELLPVARALNAQVPVVRVALNDGDRSVSLAANEALEAMADARSGWLGLARGVPRLPGKEQSLPGDPLQPGLAGAVPYLARELTHADVRVRLAALYVLETMADEAAPAAQAVVKAARDEDRFVRWGAARVLAGIAPREAALAVSGLAGLLNDPGDEVRHTAARALARYRSAARSALPALMQAVIHRDPATRQLAARALAAVGADAQSAAAVLIRALSDEESMVRSAAARALGKIGRPGPSTVEGLTAALHDPDDDVRQAAEEALLMVK